MKYKTLLAIMIMLSACSGRQQSLTTEVPKPLGSDLGVAQKTGLIIENSINHGARYTASDSTEYWIIHITSTIKNDTTIPIQLQMSFAKEYDHLLKEEEQKFNPFFLPKIFTKQGVRLVTDNAYYTDSIQAVLQNYLGSDSDFPYAYTNTLEPGEKVVLPIGAHYPSSSKYGIIPNAILSQRERMNFDVCENLLTQTESIDSSVALGLKLSFRDGETADECLIIPCGQFSYLKQ